MMDNPCGYVEDAGTEKAHYCMKEKSVHHRRHSFVPMTSDSGPSLLCVKCSGGGPFPSSNRISLDILDFPTAWTIANKMKKHVDANCSFVQTDGAVLCDCGMVEKTWELLKAVVDSEALVTRFFP